MTGESSRVSQRQRGLRKTFKGVWSAEAKGHVFPFSRYSWSVGYGFLMGESLRVIGRTQRNKIYHFWLTEVTDRKYSEFGKNIVFGPHLLSSLVKIDLFTDRFLQFKETGELSGHQVKCFGSPLNKRRFWPPASCRGHLPCRWGEGLPWCTWRPNGWVFFLGQVINSH